MGGGFAVGHHDDLALAPLGAHEVATEREGVLEVGAVGVVDGECRDVLDTQFLGHLAKAHHCDEVARELRANQLGEREHHLLRGHQVRAHRHRQREVDGEDRRGPPRRFVLLDLEVVGVQSHGRARALAQHGVAQRFG